MNEAKIACSVVFNPSMSLMPAGGKYTRYGIETNSPSTRTFWPGSTTGSWEAMPALPSAAATASPSCSGNAEQMSDFVVVECCFFVNHTGQVFLGEPLRPANHYRGRPFDSGWGSSPPSDFDSDRVAGWSAPSSLSFVSRTTTI